jgi:hypothetical protein
MQRPVRSSLRKGRGFAQVFRTAGTGGGQDVEDGRDRNEDSIRGAPRITIGSRVCGPGLEFACTGVRSLGDIEAQGVTREKSR